MIAHKIWDPFVRVFHWSLVLGFAANALVLEEGDLHEAIGYAIAALVGARILWGLVGLGHARFSDFWPTRAGIAAQLADIATGRRRVHLGHTPLGALMILNLIVTLLAIAATGHMMTTLRFFGMEWMEEAHEALVVWAELSVLAHIAAILWESLRTGVNLPLAMVTGVKSVPTDAMVEK